MVREAYQTPEVSRHRVPLKGLARPLRVVQMSDLHTGLYIHEETLKRWVALANAQRPDLIVVTGDFVDRFSLNPLPGLGRALARLRAPLGVWGVWGNHDRWRFRDVGPLLGALDAANIRILNNDGVRLRDDFYLAGVDDVLEGSPNLTKALRNLPEDAASLLMLHNPDFLPHVPARVGLTLSGHTHGGQIKAPLYGAIFTSSDYGKRYAEGWVRENAYVSRGLGVTVLPFRLDCPPELVVMDLKPA